MLNVKNGGHWVLANGVTADGYTVNDPGPAKDTYPFNEVVQAGIYRPLKKLAFEQTSS